MSKLKQKMLELGGKEWNKNGLERVYINCSILNTLRKELYKGDFFQPYTLSDSNNKFFFDVNKNAVMRSYKGKSPSLEIQY